jgi:hypothetical protein
MRPRFATATAVSLLFSATVPCAVQGASDPTITVDTNLVTVEGLDPGAQVVLLGVIRRVIGTIPGFERWLGVLVDDDGDGTVRVEIENDIRPDRSAWVAVDTASGVWTMSELVAPGFSPEKPPSETTLAAGATVWLLPMGKVEGVVVRPSGSPSIYWGCSAWDGGPADGDGTADGAVGVAVSSLESPPGEGPVPVEFVAGDLLVAIEPKSLTLQVARVTEQDVP